MDLRTRTSTAGWRVTAEQQCGVLTRQQALAGGMTPDQWQWRLHAGQWQALLPGVAVLHSGGLCDDELAWAAVLACGPGAALSGDAALRAHGMQLPPPAPWHVVTPGPSATAARCGSPVTQGRLRVQPHRATRLPEVLHPVHRPAVLRPAAALLHAVSWAPSDRAAEWRVAAAVQQRVVTPAQVRLAQAVLLRTGRRTLVAAVLDDVELGAHARSELDLLRFLRAHGLPPPDRLQLLQRHGTHRHYLDAWWSRPRLAVEMDGAHHRSAGTWESDLLRTNRLAVAGRSSGSVLLRLTPHMLRHDGDEVLRLLRPVLL